MIDVDGITLDKSTQQPDKSTQQPKQPDKSTQQPKKPRVVVIGVGGGGSNAVKHMIQQKDLQGCEFAVCNTDAQALENFPCDNIFVLGRGVTDGLGAGAKPEVGKECAEESIKDIEDFVDGADMVFLSVGMGGGTGTGASPVIAEMIQSKEIMCIGVVSKPFVFEGTPRMRVAQDGIKKLEKHVDALIVIPNENLISKAGPEATFMGALQIVDDILLMGVQAIVDLIFKPGQWNLDFNDICTVLEESGKAIIGIGEISKTDNKEDAAEKAAEQAVNNTLLEYNNISEARAVLVNVTSNENILFTDMTKACLAIKQFVHPDANIIFGTSLNTDEDFNDLIRLSVLATGIANEAKATAEIKIGDKTLQSVPNSHLGEDDTDTDPPENTGDTHPSTSLEDSASNPDDTPMQDTNTHNVNEETLDTDTPSEGSEHGPAPVTTSETQQEPVESSPSELSSSTMETNNNSAHDTVRESLENNFGPIDEGNIYQRPPEQLKFWDKILRRNKTKTENKQNKTKTENKQAPVETKSTTKPTEFPDFLESQKN